MSGTPMSDAHPELQHRSLARETMGEDALRRLAGDGPAKFAGLDPFGGRKIRTKETLGGMRSATGGEEALLHEPKLVKHLNKFKEHKPDEQLMFASMCEKINDKMKRQERILVVTTQALYNVDPDGYKVKRRIDLRAIDELSLSCLDDDYLVLHVPSEYSDYLYVAPRKTELCKMLQDRMRDLTGRELKMNVSNGISYRMEKKNFSIIFAQMQGNETSVKIYST